MDNLPKSKTNYFSLVLISFCFVAFMTGVYFLGRMSVSSSQITTTTATPTNIISILSTYTNQDFGISFQYPKEFIPQSKQILGSSFSQEFVDNQKHILTFRAQANYNQQTGKEYKDLDEFIGMSYQVKTMVVDGQDARQPLPRAGSENINSVNFFSLDKKYVLTVELQTGENSMNTTESEIDVGDKIFTQILSGFKFIN